MSFQMRPCVEAVCLVLWLVALSYGRCTSLYEVSDDSTIVRENYGVTFHQRGMLDNAHSVWHQTFVIPIGRTKLPDVHLYCTERDHKSENSSLTMETFCPALIAYNERHHQLTTDIWQAEENIYAMLQEHDVKRPRRAILGFVGRFAKSLFGVSTEEDTSILARQIQTLQNLALENQDDLATLFDDFQSYIIKEDKKLELLKKYNPPEPRGSHNHFLHCTNNNNFSA